MYKIGQICIGQNISVAPHLNGMDCEIVGDLKLQTGIFYDGTKIVTVKGYKVKWANGETTRTREFQLRPKHEPGSWDDIEDELGWNPTKELCDGISQ